MHEKYQPRGQMVCSMTERSAPQFGSVLPPAEVVLGGILSDPPGNFLTMHEHFTDVLGHHPHETVLDWQTRTLFSVLSLLDCPHAHSVPELDSVVSLLDRHCQEVQLPQVLVSGSSHLGDKPMVAQMYWNMLMGAIWVGSGWPYKVQWPNGWPSGERVSLLS